MGTTVLRAFLGAAVGLLAACANTYDFASARLPGGGWNFPKLVADFEAGGGKPLFAGTWLPLVRAHSTTFDRSEESVEALYMLNDLELRGPLVCTGDEYRFLVDREGRLIERRRTHWAFWGVPTYKRHLRIETIGGPRRETFERLCVFFASREIWYPKADGAK